MKYIQLAIWIFLWTIVLLLGLLAIKTTIGVTQKDENITIEITTNKYDLYLKQLIRFECRHCAYKNNNFKRLDSNGKFSYGCLQFQLRTFISMARRYNIASKEETDVDIVRHIYECDYQKRIASSMFAENEVKASNHWYTTIYKKGLGLPSEQ